MIRIEDTTGSTREWRADIPPVCPVGRAVVVVDTCRLFRQGLAGLMASFGFHVPATGATVPATFDQLSATDDAGCTVKLMIYGVCRDQSLADHLAELRHARAISPAVKIVLLMTSCTDEDLVTCLRCGVDGIVLRETSGELLAAALDLVINGQHVLPLGVANRVFAGLPAADRPPPLSLAPSSALPRVPATEQTMGDDGARGRPARGSARTVTLSDRESQILQGLVCGYANKQIARQLAIAEATVKVHVKGLLRKINVSNRTQAAIWAVHQRFPAGTPDRPVDRSQADRNPTITGLRADPDTAGLAELFVVAPPAAAALPFIHS